jgi:ribosomal protein S18 acetylase RimI-like enzyme
MVQIRVLGPGDERVLERVAADVFDNPVSPDWTRVFLADPHHHLVVAIDDGIVVGFVSGVHYLHPDKAPQLWINEIGVAPTHQGRGIGNALMARMLDIGRDRACTMAWVLTDRSNAAACALYRALGATEGADDEGLHDTIGFSFALRAGAAG